jgi:hypothetical protein
MEMRERRKTSSLSLLFVLNESRFREATDPWDRVYAALGVTTDPIASHIKPDYNSPVGEVYRDLAKVWIRKAEPGHRLDILGCLDDVTSTTPKVRLPDWRKPLNAGPLYKHSKESITADRSYRADGGALEEVLFTEHYAEVKGARIDGFKEILRVSDKVYDILTEKQRGSTCASCGYPTVQDARSAFLHTVTADAESRIGTYIVDGYHVQFDTRRRNHAIDWHFEDREDTISSPSDVAMTGSLFGDMKRATHRRRFVWTNNGFMGLVPKDTKVGDRVCILFGGSVLYILSTHPDSDWLDVCIGQCYIHGLMDGEAFEAFGQGGMLR